MKRLFGWMSAALLSLALSGIGFADSDIGQHCFNFNENIDTLRVAASLSSGPANMGDLHGRWRAATLYQLVGAGAITDSIDPQYMWEMSLNFSHQTDYFGMNRTCYLHAFLDRNYNGPWNLECVGGGTPPYFANNGTLSYVPCTPAMISQQSEGELARAHLPAAGE